MQVPQIHTVPLIGCKMHTAGAWPPPDTTQRWEDPSPNPPPWQTAPASPPPVPPSNPLGQAGPPPDKCQTWNDGPEGPAMAADNSAKDRSVFWGT
ncbi:hypothetical protein E4T56_gene12003 [Termitomyces sp. T112]|nr:hypothetical protein E4T56_gene12003 [Termitomyces sp. T112]